VGLEGQVILVGLKDIESKQMSFCSALGVYRALSCIIYFDCHVNLVGCLQQGFLSPVYIRKRSERIFFFG